MSAHATAAWSAKIGTPFAVLGLRSDGRALTQLHYLPLAEPVQAPTDAVAEFAAGEIEAWLRDSGYRFTVALAPAGTPFRQRVWTALRTIPPGERRTYGDVARQIGSAPRAVGQACGDNPLPLVIPCHRVVGAQGALGGFMHAAAGNPLAIKRWLLAHEGARLPA